MPLQLHQNGFSPTESYGRLLNRIPQALQNLLTVDDERSGKRLEVANVRVDTRKFQGFDLDDLQQAARNEATLAAPIFADVRLIDKRTNKVISEAAGVRIGDVPHITPKHYGFMLHGSEYDVFNQSRLRSGLYTHVRQNGELTTTANLAKGRNFTLSYDADSGTVRFGIGHGTVPLIPVLMAIGVDPDTIRAQWGNEFFNQNMGAIKNHGAELRRAARMVSGREPVGDADAVQVIRDYFAKTQTDPEVNMMTIGHPAKTVDGQTLMNASQKLMAVYRGDAEPDDRDHFMFQDVYSPDDLIITRLSHWRTMRDVQWKLKQKLARMNNVQQIVKSADVGGTINKFFLAPAEGSAGLIGLNDQTNPLQFTSPSGKITKMGEGGISGSHAIPMSTRFLHNSHFGIVDPVALAENSNLGVVLNLSNSAQKIGNRFGIRAVDARTGQEVTAQLIDFQSKITALPDQYTVDKSGARQPKGQMIRAFKGGKMLMVKPQQVDFIMPDPNSVFSMNMSLVPRIGGISGARALIGYKMIEQAIPLAHREAPLVRDGVEGASFGEDPSRGAARVADVDGTVEKIEPNRIWIRTPDNQLVKHGLYDHYPTQSEVLLTHLPVVHEGDRVKAGQLIADSNFTQNGVLALGTHLVTAILPDREARAHEDGTVISASAAKKLSSEHVHVKEFALHEDAVLGKAKYRAFLPGHISDASAKRLDDEGVILPGEDVMPGDPLVLGLTKRRPDAADAVLRRMGRKLVKTHNDAAVAWDGKTAGKVVRVDRLADKIKVYIRTLEPMKVGDKMATMGSGGKTIITHIVADDEMPKRPDGSHVEVLFNGIGFVGRVNPAAPIGIAAGKIAQHDGKPYYVKGMDDSSYVDEVYQGLKKRGLNDEEDLVDPKTGRVIKGIMVGPGYWLKLKHQVDHKNSYRDVADYDIDGQPLRGGENGAKRMDTLQSFAMMAHGANANLADVSVNKSNRNPEMIRAIKMGLPLPPPRPAFAVDKFLSLLKAAGINPVKRGTEIRLTPMTDAETLKISNGAIESGRFLRAEDATAEKGGFFSPETTGGMHGEKWAHIPLAEPLPNPVMEPAIMSVLGITEAELEGVVAGKLGQAKDGTLQPYAAGMPTGGALIRSMLSQIDPANELESVKQQLMATKSKTAIDKLNKRGRYLRALVEANVAPADAYTMQHLPVLPPKMRPAYALPNGTIEVGSLNYLYRDAFLVNDKLKALAGLDPDILAPLRSDLYDAVKAVQGLGDPVSGRDYQGVISTIKGRGGPKGGMFQSKLLARPMDNVGRSTIIPDPNLSPDEVGIPEEMAWTIYQPKIVRELVQSGMTPVVAAKETEDRTGRASIALDRVMAVTPVLVNRAPSLHKFSVMALKPHRVTGEALQMPPMPFKGWNADVDGDSMIGDIIVRENGGAPQILSIPEIPRGRRASDQIKKNHQLRMTNDYFAMPGNFEAFSIGEGLEAGWHRIAQVSNHNDIKMYKVWLSGLPEPLIVSRDRSLTTIDPENLEPCAISPMEAMGRLVPVAWRLDCSRLEEPFAENDAETGFVHGLALAGGLVRNGETLLRCRRSLRKALPRILTLANFTPTGPVFRLTYKEFHGQEFHQPLLGERFNPRELGTLYHPRGSNLSVLPMGKAQLVDDFKERVRVGSGLKDLPGRSLVYKLGHLIGLMAGAETSVSRTNGDANERVLIQQRFAKAVRLAGMLAGVELRFFESVKPGFFVPRAGYIDAITRLRLKEVADRLALDRLPRALRVFLREPDGDCLKRGELAIARNGLMYGLEGTYQTDKQLPWSPKMLAADMRYIGRYSSISVFTKLLDATHDREDFRWQDSVSVWKLTKYLANAPAPIRDCTYMRKLARYLDTTVSYEKVIAVEEIMGRKTGYDISVPTAQVFCEASGASLKNTMMVSVPISPEAVEESWGMLPSKHLFNPGTGDLMLLPKAEAVHGAYLLTKAGRRTKLRFPDEKSATKAYEDGQIEATDVVLVNNVETTPGRIKFNAALPEKYRDPGIVADMKKIRTILADVAKTTPDAYSDVAMGIKKLGDESAYFGGMSFGLKDMLPPSEIRDPILKKAEAELAKRGYDPDAAVEIYGKANEELKTKVAEHYRANGNRLWELVDSGALGSKSGQLMQMIVAPVLVNDERGRPVPFPVGRSFAEGLNVTDYWTTMYGQRKGMIDRRLSTAEPGEIQKEVIVASLKQQVVEDDCGAGGIDLSLDNRSVLSRRLSADLKAGDMVLARRGERVTQDLLTAARKNGLKTISVRSPLACETLNGICQSCAGFDEQGQPYKLGMNFGALAATTITEPLTQGVLRNFHQGGTAFSKTVSGLDRIRQLVELPQILASQGTLATTPGLVEKIGKTPAGDHEIIVAGKKHFVHSDLEPVVEVGQKVNHGQPLSTGVQKPQEILATRGLQAARNYIVDELDRAYKEGNNIDLDRRFFESVAKTVSDHGYVEDPGDHPSLLKGDLIPMTRIEKMNKDLTARKLTPISYTPQLKGVVQTAVVSDDWMARLGSRYLGKSIQNGVGYGLKTDFGERGHVTPRYVFGVHMADKPSASGVAPIEDVEFDGPLREYRPERQEKSPAGSTVKISP